MENMERDKAMISAYRKVALLGPESSGKSTLAATLAGHYTSLWVPEFARAYLGGFNRTYDRDDVIECAKGQRRWEEQVLGRTSSTVFFDTEMINLHVWINDKFGDAPDWLLEGLPSRYDFYLLTAPDLPFEHDPLRENPERRQYFFERYRDEIKRSDIPYAVVSGLGNDRLASALDALSGIAPHILY